MMQIMKAMNEHILIVEGRMKCILLKNIKFKLILFKKEPNWKYGIQQSFQRNKKDGKESRK